MCVGAQEIISDFFIFELSKMTRMIFKICNLPKPGMSGGCFFRGPTLPPPASGVPEESLECPGQGGESEAYWSPRSNTSQAPPLHCRSKDAPILDSRVLPVELKSK